MRAHYIWTRLCQGVFHQAAFVSSIIRQKPVPYLHLFKLQSCTMKAILFLVAVFAAVLTEVTSQTCASHSNGCSIPFDLPYFFKSRFTPSCDKHDVCYSCAVRYGKTKEDCDKMLFKDANQVCSSMKKRFIASTLSAAQTSFCKAISLSYYQATKHFGASHFSTTSESWCSGSWVRSCLP